MTTTPSADRPSCSVSVRPLIGCTPSISHAFEMLGVQPIKGRTLTEQDGRSAEGVVVISHALWQTRFEGAPDVIGRSVKLGSVAATIIGVMPEGFGFPVN